MQVRVAWNPELPVEASTTFTTGGRTFRSGDAFPWREMGLLEHEVYTMWCSCMVHHPLKAAETPPAVEVALPGVASAELAADLSKRERKARSRKAAPAQG